MDEAQCVICQVKVPGWSMECGSGALEACDGLVDQAEGDLTSDEADGATVWLVVFFRNEKCEFLECNYGRRIPTSTCGQDQRNEGTMLHFEDTLLICMLSSFHIYLFCSKHKWRIYNLLLLGS